MDDAKTQRYLRFRREKRQNGLIFGLIAGFWFGVGVWALDAVLLYQSHGDLPWIKLWIGMPFVILIGGFAGWLTARMDNAFWGAVFWLFAGLAYVWISSHIPFQGTSIAFNLLAPQFAGLDVYPFVESIRMRMSLLYIVVGFLTAVGGGFQMFFVEAATRSSSQLRRFMTLSACFVIFIPLGLMVDNLINESLRDPVIAIHDLIEAGRAAKSGSDPAKKQPQVKTRVLKTFGDLIERPYRLVLGSYDPFSLDETRVYSDFSGEWGTCAVVARNPMVCWPSTERYLRKLECLIDNGSPDACQLYLPPDGEPPDKALFENLDRSSIQFGIVDQRGSAVLVIAQDGLGQQVECVFRETGDILLDSCAQVKGKSFDLAQIPPTATRPAPTVTPTLPPIEAVEFEPQAALIDQEMIEVPVLQGAPRYTISLNIVDDLSAFQGSAQVEITNNENVALDSVYFHLLPNGKGSYGNGSLTVRETSVNGQPVETELSINDTVIKVVLSDPLEPGEKGLLGFEFEGVVPKDFGGSATPEGYGIYNLSEGVLALSGWYPILAVYDDQGWNLDPPSSIGDSVYSETGFYTVEITYPKDLKLAATGVKTAQQEIDDKLKAKFESGPTRDFFLAASPDFEVANQQVEDTLVNSYYLPGYERAGKLALSIARDSLKTYNNKFGTYPYRELDVVSAPMRNALGVEFPGIVLIGLKMYEEPDKPDFAVTIAHEVAHQWWYSTVGNDIFDEPWLDEALATYSSGVYYEYINGPEYQAGLEGYWQDRYDQLLKQDRDDLVTGSLEYFENLAGPSVYGSVVYIKGALFFKALREEIGRQAFFQALADYYQAHYFGVARTEDLLAAFENASDRDLDAFYQDWLYSKH